MARLVLVPPNMDDPYEVMLLEKPDHDANFPYGFDVVPDVPL